MSVQRRSSLGRNLSALLSQSPEALLSDKPFQKDFTRIAIAQLQPGKYQPRKDYDEQALQELTASIKQQGILQPLIVRAIGEERFEILAGERRFRAAQLAQLTEIPVFIKEVDDETAMVIALVENLQREDLNAMDQARAMGRLTEEFKLTHQQIADILGKSRTSVSNYLRLLSLPQEVTILVEHGDLDMGHARALLGLDAQQQTAIAQMIIAKNLSVRETEQLIQRMKHPKSKQSAPFNLKNIFHQELIQLTKQFQTKIGIKQNPSGKGALMIHFNSSMDLEKIMARLADS